MRCIFCKTDSTGHTSVEHIIPQSLGNIEHTLPRGVVCDICNNYFARKIEMPILHSFRVLRGIQNVLNKKGNVPEFESEKIPEPPDYRLMSRFIGKIGLEALASRLIEALDDEVVGKSGLDELRSYVRFNRGEDWPFLPRILYPCDAVFKEGDTHFDIPHEYMLLYTPGCELYVVVALFGTEFTLNLGGRALDGYKKWLKEHAYGSPLYPNGIDGYYTRRLDLIERGLPFVRGFVRLPRLAETD